MKIVTSDAFSPENRNQTRALGSGLTLVPSAGGLTTRRLILELLEVARRPASEPHNYWTGQAQNHDASAGYLPPAKESSPPTHVRVGAFVRGVAAIRLARRLGPGARSVARMSDSGLEYRDTDAFRLG